MARRALNKVLFNLTAGLHPESEEAAQEFLSNGIGSPAAVFTNLEAGRTWVTVYSENRERLKNLGKDLAAVAPAWELAGLTVQPLEIKIERVKRIDWAESWKKYFKTIRVGRKLLIKPSWSREKNGKGQVSVVLDPGLSFGTGQHATTSFCLGQLTRLRKTGTAQSFLDVGMGSGILAISAAKLGYSPVRAFDFDPVSVRVALANARRNRVAHKIRMHRGDITRFKTASGERYDLICANLMTELLVAERHRLVGLMAAEGSLVLAGILASQFDGLVSAFREAGVRLDASLQEKEWKSGLFHRQVHSDEK